MPGRPDFIFPKLRHAVFVHGCFWHGCRIHGRVPASNEGYWGPKLRRNSERDREVLRALKARGWTAMTIWEHELSRKRQPALERRLLRWKAASVPCGAGTRRR